MPQEHSKARRRFLIAGLGAAVGTLAGRPAAAQVKAACDAATPAQTGGPFFPTRDRADEDHDLTRVEGAAGRALGDVIQVRGRVLDESCRPVPGALVEVWQANAAGRYDHERDAGNPRPLDPNFQGWAELLTDADGRYQFTTVKPGSYPADDRGWIRPPHIHFKVSRRGYHELLTQMYFDGEPLNDADRIRGALEPGERRRVTVDLRHAGPDMEPGTRLGLFDITLRAVV